VAIEKIEWVLVQGGVEEETIRTHYKQLLRRQHDFLKGYISFFSYLHSPRDDEEQEASLERYRSLKEECEYHIGQHEGYYKKYPDDILSVLHSNLARALFKIDYISKNEYQNQAACELHFDKAISFKPDNWYAHNWYATFLKEARKDFEGARNHYDIAVRGDRNNPVFPHNLALLHYEWPTFSRQRLETAQRDVRESQALCQKDQQWGNFISYPEELLAKINLLLGRSDLRDGEPLDADELLPVDTN